jgi:hypothetical protein
MAAVLRATLTIEPRYAARPEELTARCELANDGDEVAVLNLAPFSSPSLALEIVDERGEAVHLPPPPVPGADVPLADLAPGQRYSADFTGFLPTWIPPGRYRARCRYVSGTSDGRWLEATVWSDWADFAHG